MNISLNAIQHPHRPLLPLGAHGEQTGYWSLLKVLPVQDPVSRKTMTSRLCALQPEKKELFLF